MPATIAEARDQMGTRLLATVAASSYSNLVLVWDDSAKDPVQPDPSTTVPWARVKFQHTSGGNTGVGKVGGLTRVTRSGFIVVQLFVPANKGLVSHDPIVRMILSAYEGKTTIGGLVFRKCRFQEIGQDGPWFQTNIFVDFSYDDLQ